MAATLKLNPTYEIVDGVSVDASQVNNLVNTAEAQNVGSGNTEIAAAAIESGAVFGGVTGTAGTTTPALRALGTGANDAAAGNAIPAFAAGLKAGANTLPLDTSAISTGAYLTFDGTKITGGTPSSTTATAGVGTVSTGTSSPTVTGVSTKFTTQLQVGYLITVGAVTWRIIAIASDTSLTVNANWGANNSGQAYSYQVTTRARPWNTVTAKTTTFSGAATDAGNVFSCDTSGGAYTGTLPAANSFLPGDTIAFIKITDDLNSLSVTCAGSDTYVDTTVTMKLTTYGASVTLQSDGVSIWRVVASFRLPGRLLQVFRQNDTTTTSISTHLAKSVTPTTGNTTKITGISGLTITPYSANTVLKIHVTLQGNCNTNGQYIVVAIFGTVSGPTVTLLGIGVIGVPQGSSTVTNSVDIYTTTGGIGAIQIDTYLALTGGTYYYNSDVGGAAMFGGLKSFIEVSEVAV